jgi:hypothetical protein
MGSLFSFVGSDRRMAGGSRSKRDPRTDDNNDITPPRAKQRPSGCAAGIGRALRRGPPT